MSVDVPILKIMDSAGIIYQLATVPTNGFVMSGDEELFYEEQSINSCQTITLEAGRYRVELKGGKGGGVDIGTSATYEGEIINYEFDIKENTPVYLFRGGDGTGICSGSGVSGGGSSGVDSLLVVNDTAVVAHGGNGAAYGCRGYNAGKAIGRNAYTEGLPGGGGFSTTRLGYYNKPLVDARPGSCMAGIAVIAGGGGGAIKGTCPMSSSCAYKTSNIEECQEENANCSAGATPGTSGTQDKGGDGGTAYLTYKDISMSAVGGIGGATVKWSCGGHFAYSYGGGGGGAVCTGGFLINSELHNGFKRDLICIPGMPGGSGSTNESTTSHIRIFKID